MIMVKMLESLDNFLRFVIKLLEFFDIAYALV